MKIEAKIYKANRTINQVTIEKTTEGESFVGDLEWCLVQACKALDIPIPLWLDKNTKEFAKFRQTVFFEEQFIDKVPFNRYQIKLLK